MNTISTNRDKVPLNQQSLHWTDHNRAHGYGFVTSFKNRCKCCQRYIDKVPLRLTFSQQYLFYCGPQLAAYFNIIKILVVSLLMLTLVYSLPMFLIHINSNACNSLFCGNSWFILSSVFNSFQEDRLDFLAYLTIPQYIVIFLGAIWMRIKCRQILRSVEQLEIFPASYTVLLKLPFNHLTEASISHQIEVWFKKQLKHNKQELWQLFPELYQSKLSPNLSIDVSSIYNQSQKIAKQSPSKFIQSIILSHNYTQFEDIRTQIQQFAGNFKQELNSNVPEQKMQNLLRMVNVNNNILSAISTNKYCLVIFKEIKYAQYFASKTTPSLFQSIFCFEKFREMKIENEGVSVIGNIFPTQIYWQNLHLNQKEVIKSGCSFYIGCLISFILLSGLEFGIIYFVDYSSLGISISNFDLIFSAIISTSLLVSNKILHYLFKRQKQRFYEQGRISFVVTLVIYNTFLISFLPLLFYSLMEKQALFTHFIYTSAFALVIFILSSSLVVYFSPKAFSLYVNFCKQQNLQKLNRPKLIIQDQLTIILTLLSNSLFLVAFIPSFLPLSLVLITLIYLLQRINIAKLYQEGPYYGINLVIRIIKLIQKSFILPILGNVSIYCLAYLRQSIPISMASIIINIICLTITLILQFIKLDSIAGLFDKKQQQSINKQKMIRKPFNKAKQKFIMSYQSYNYPYNYKFNLDKGMLQQNNTRAKIFEQMNTMSKTLTLSLKERLMNNISPALNQVSKRHEGAEDDQINNIYFEYQRKVQMKKSKPKVIIPPLFQNNNAIDLQVSLNNQDNINFYSVFSENDQEARQILKDHIKKKLKECAVGNVINT